MIIWLKCANNNRAETVHNHFMHSITEFQFPRQVRGDKGSENRLIAKHMMILRGSETKGFQVADLNTILELNDYGENMIIMQWITLLKFSLI